ncbi:hypothetical protein D3C81_1603490 [compost metagenome]
MAAACRRYARPCRGRTPARALWRGTAQGPATTGNRHWHGCAPWPRWPRRFHRYRTPGARARQSARTFAQVQGCATSCPPAAACRFYPGSSAPWPVTGRYTGRPPPGCGGVRKRGNRYVPTRWPGQRVAAKAACRAAREPVSARAVPPAHPLSARRSAPT